MSSWCGTWLGTGTALPLPLPNLNPGQGLAILTEAFYDFPQSLYVIYLEIGHDYFLSCPLQFTINILSFHLMLNSLFS
jgi:hypothetical protein